MLRAVGAVLVAAGCGWIGFHAAEGLRRRNRALRDMARALERMERELELGAPPLVRLLERGAQGGAEGFFRACIRGLDRLEEERFGQLWQRLAQEQSALGPEGRQALSALGDGLGRYEGRAQREQLRAVRRRLEELARAGEEERRRQGRVYQVLGLSGGAFLIILLL